MIPDSDEARAVLADELIERGNPRGELIHVQLALARLRPGDEGYGPLLATQDRLIVAHAPHWLPGRPIARLRRGWIEWMSVLGLVDAEHRLRTDPIKGLRFQNRPPSEELPGHLEEVGLAIPPGTSTIVEIGRRLRHLRRVDFPVDEEQTLRALPASVREARLLPPREISLAPLARLERIELPRMVASAGWLRSCASLPIRDLGLVGIGEVSAAPLEKLDTLAIDARIVPPAVLAEVAARAGMLRQLSIATDTLDEPHLEALAPLLARLGSLDLRRCARTVDARRFVGPRLAIFGLPPSSPEIARALVDEAPPSLGRVMSTGGDAVNAIIASRWPAAWRLVAS